MNFTALLRAAAIAGLAALLGACTFTAPPYQASVTSADVTDKLNGPLAVGKFEFAPGRAGELNSVGARAGRFLSPVNNSYADYFADAASKELAAAGKLDPAAPKVLTGVLLKNHLTAADSNLSTAELEVRFRLADQGKVLYEKVIESRREAESHFLGGLAIPRALDSYLANLQVLLRKLFADPEFIAATKAK